MAAKGRIVYYKIEETLHAVLEGQSDESEKEVSNSSDTESDHLSEPSDQSDTESALTLPHDRFATDQAVTPKPPKEPRRGCGRGQNRGQAREREQPIRVEGERKISLRMCLSPIEPLRRPSHQMEVNVACNT